MIKKMMLLAVAAAAVIAFAVPAAASAEVELTNVEPGETVTALSTNTETTINLETALYCSTVHLEGTYEGNGVIGGITGTAAPCEITGTLLKPVVTSITANVTLNEGGTGTASFKFGFDIHEVGLTGCSEETVLPIGVSYTSGSNSINIAGGPLKGAGPNCPAGAEEIHGDFELTNAFEEPVVVHG